MLLSQIKYNIARYYVIETDVSVFYVYNIIQDADYKYKIWTNYDLYFHKKNQHTSWNHCPTLHLKLGHEKAHRAAQENVIKA